MAETNVASNKRSRGRTGSPKKDKATQSSTVKPNDDLYPSFPSDFGLEEPTVVDSQGTAATSFHSSFSGDNFLVFDKSSSNSNHDDMFYNKSAKEREEPNRKLPLRAPSRIRGRSHSPPRRVLSDGGVAVRPTLQSLENERRKMSLFLGDEQFDANDVSAVLGDFSVPGQAMDDEIDFVSPVGVIDFPGVDLSTSNQPFAEHKKDERQNYDNQQTTKDGVKGLKKLRKLMGASEPSSSAETHTITAQEALEKGAAVQDMGILERKLQARRRQFMQQPDSQTTSATSTTSLSTAGQSLGSVSAASPWDTQTQPQAPRRNSIQKLRSFIRPLAATEQFQQVNTNMDNSSFSVNSESMLRRKVALPFESDLSVASDASSIKSNNKRRRPKKNKRGQRKARHEAPPQPPSTTATKPHAKSVQKKSTHAHTFRGRPNKHHTGPSSDGDRDPLLGDSQMSLTLADLHRSSSSMNNSSKKSFRSRTSSAPSSSLSSSSIAKTSTRSTRRPRHAHSSKSQKPQQMSSSTLSTMDSSSSSSDFDHSIYSLSSYNNSKALMTDESNTTATLLESLALDTVPEIQNEDSSEATSRHTALSDSPKESRLSFSSTHSIPKDGAVPSPKKRHRDSLSTARLVMSRKPSNESDNKAQRGKRSITRANSGGDVDIVDDDDEESQQNSDQEEGPSSVVSQGSYSPHGREDVNKSWPAPGRTRQGKSPAQIRRRSLADVMTGDDDAEYTSYSLNELSAATPIVSNVRSRLPDPLPNVSHASEQDLRHTSRDPHTNNNNNKSHQSPTQMTEGDHDSLPGGSHSTRRGRRDIHAYDSPLHGHRSVERSTSSRRDPSRREMSESDSISFWEDETYDDDDRSASFRRSPGLQHYMYDYEAEFQRNRDRAGMHDPYHEFRYRKRTEDSARFGDTRRDLFSNDPSFAAGYNHDFRETHSRASVPDDRPCRGGRVRMVPPMDFRYVHGGRGEFGGELPAYYVGAGDDHSMERKVAAYSRELPMRGQLRRRHSIGSGHSRDSIIDEVSTAMEQEYKYGLCNHCRQPVDLCQCSVFHHSVEPIIDISRRTRGYSRGRRQGSATVGPRDLETRLTSSGTMPNVSLFDTFGIKYLDPDFGERNRASKKLDDEIHSWYRPSPAHVPLYHRPDCFEVNEYVHSSRAQRIDNEPNRRGRSFGRHVAEPPKVATGIRGYGTRSSQDKRRVDDDGSLRYPRRPSFGSVSGRSQRSCLDDASLQSFAI